jgi:hypothetical protein
MNIVPSEMQLSESWKMAQLVRNRLPSPLDSPLSLPPASDS